MYEKRLDLKALLSYFELVLRGKMVLGKKCRSHSNEGLGLAFVRYTRSFVRRRGAMLDNTEIDFDCTIITPIKKHCNENLNLGSEKSMIEMLPQDILCGMTKTDVTVQTLSDINPDVVLEANQKMSKVVLLKDLYLEIYRMKQDVRASREKNGVYIPHERFAHDEVKKKQQGLRQQQQQLLQSMPPVQRAHL